MKRVERRRRRWSWSQQWRAVANGNSRSYTSTYDNGVNCNLIMNYLFFASSWILHTNGQAEPMWHIHITQILSLSFVLPMSPKGCVSVCAVIHGVGVCAFVQEKYSSFGRRHRARNIKGHEGVRFKLRTKINRMKDKTALRNRRKQWTPAETSILFTKFVRVNRRFLCHYLGNLYFQISSTSWMTSELIDINAPPSITHQRQQNK